MRIVVTGTGTGVGKTEVACAILRASRRAGHEPRGLKPIMTGQDGLSDVDRLGIAAGTSFGAIYQWPQPVSPHLAARWAGEHIDLVRIREWVESNAGRVTLVETAGGLLSPLSDEATNLDLVRSLQPARNLIVCPARLGVLHDATACLLAIRSELTWFSPTIVLYGIENPLETARQRDEIARVVLPKIGSRKLLTLEAAPTWMAEDSLYTSLL